MKKLFVFFVFSILCFSINAQVFYRFGENIIGTFEPEPEKRESYLKIQKILEETSDTTQSDTCNQIVYLFFSEDEHKKYIVSYNFDALTELEELYGKQHIYKQGYHYWINDFTGIKIKYVEFNKLVVIVFL